MSNCRMASYCLIALALVMSAVCGMCIAQSRPSTGEADIEKLKKVVLMPGTGTVGEKLQAVHAIRDIGGKPAIRALLELLGKVEPKQVGQAVISSLGQLDSEEAKQGLADMATDPVVGDFAINQLERMISSKDQVLLKQLLTTIQDKGEKLPVSNVAEAIRLFETKTYKPAAPFVRQMVSQQDDRVQTAALRAIGVLGEKRDTTVLWQSLETSKDRLVQAAAIRSIGQLGGDEDVKKLLIKAETIQKMAKPDSPEFMSMTDLIAAVSTIRAKAIEGTAAPVTIKTRTTTEGIELVAEVPDQSQGVLVSVLKGRERIAIGLVHEKTIKIDLPTGTYNIVVSAVVPQDAQSIKQVQRIVAFFYEPEQLLHLGKEVRLEEVAIKESIAKRASVANAITPRSVDEYAATIKKQGLPNAMTGPVAVEGVVVPWPGGWSSKLHLDNSLQTSFFKRRGLKLAGAKEFVYLETGSNSLSTVKPGSKAVIVGQLCPVWNNGKAYAFMAIDAWPSDIEAGSVLDAKAPETMDSTTRASQPAK